MAAHLLPFSFVCLFAVAAPTKGEDEPKKKDTIAKRLARFTARRPRTCLVGAIVVTLILSYIGFGLGDFKIAVDNEGWRSRGTLIAKREMQNDVLMRMKQALFQDTDGSTWYDVENNVIEGFQALEERDDENDGDGEKEDGNGDADGGRRFRRTTTTTTTRNLLVDGCDAQKYYGNILAQRRNLFAMYKTEAKSDTSTLSILEPDVLFEICEAEAATHTKLEENAVCGGCTSSNQCLPPYSLILVLKLYLNETLDVSCSELKEKYTGAVQESFTNDLVEW